MNQKNIMKYQLPSGIYVEISIELYCCLSDDDIQNMIADNIGSYYDNPFSESVIEYSEDINKDYDFIEQEVEDLLSIADNDKIIDDDFFNIDELET